MLKSSTFRLKKYMLKSSTLSLYCKLRPMRFYGSQFAVQREQQKRCCSTTETLNSWTKENCKEFNVSLYGKRTYQRTFDIETKNSFIWKGPNLRTPHPIPKVQYLYRKLRVYDELVTNDYLSTNMSRNLSSFNKLFSFAVFLYRRWANKLPKFMFNIFSPK